jgi:hypothetical protein
LKGGVLLMGGPAKIGKTFLGLDLAHSLGVGGQVWGLNHHVIEPTPTLYVDKELGVYGFQERVQMRYKELGIRPPDNLFFLSKPPDFYLDTGPGIAKLREEVKATGAKVVILDPISKCLAGDENSNNDVNRLFLNLDNLLSEFPEMGLILLHHYGKPPKGEDAANWDPYSPYNFRGAAKWFDSPDSLITFQRFPAMRADEWWRLHAGMELRHAKRPDDIIKLGLTEGGLVRPVLEPVEDEPAKPKKRWR